MDYLLSGLLTHYKKHIISLFFINWTGDFVQGWRLGVVELIIHFIDLLNYSMDLLNYLTELMNNLANCSLIPLL